MRVGRLVLAFVVILTLSYCSTEVPVPSPGLGIPIVKYRAKASCYFEDNEPELCESISGELITITEQGEYNQGSNKILGYKLNFSFRDFQLEISLYKKGLESDLIDQQFSVGSQYIEVDLKNINYDETTGYVLITDYTHNCIEEDMLGCWEYYVTPRGIFEFGFINSGEDRLIGTEDDSVFTVEKGIFYPE